MHDSGTLIAFLPSLLNLTIFLLSFLQLDLIGMVERDVLNDWWQLDLQGGGFRVKIVPWEPSDT